MAGENHSSLIPFPPPQIPFLFQSRPIPPPQVFQRHNETCNIWTHLVGLAIFIAITISMAYDWGRYRLPRLPDTWTFGECILILLVWAILLTPGFFLTQRG